MKKIIIVIALALILIVALAGCSVEDAVSTGDGGFDTLSNNYYGRVVVDRETGVMYWMSCFGDSKGVLTLLVNADGSPRIWEGEK